MRKLAAEGWHRPSIVPIAALVSLALAGCRYESEEEVSTPPPPPPIEELAPPEEVLGRMVEFMMAQRDFSFQAFVTYEAVQDDGQIIHFDMVQIGKVSRPDRMFWAVLYDDASVDSAWFADGILSVVKRPDDLYTQLDTPDNLAGMVDFADDFALVVPFADILRGNAKELFLSESESSINVGQAWVDGVWTDHIAVRKADVDIEVWVRSEGDPVPVKLAIIYKLEEGAPSFLGRMRGWDFTPNFDESTFTFAVPQDADPVEVAPVH